ncbi:MAG: FadD3 family acyl-CoA ligase [Acidimicrobiales bacterium]
MNDAQRNTIPSLLRAAAAAWPDSEALVEDELRLTFEQLVDTVYQAARSLIVSGLEPGDRVAIWAPNISEWIVAALGTHEAGGVVVPINTRFKGREAGFVLTRSQARFLFTVSDFLETNYVEMLADADAGGDLAELIVMRGEVDDGCTSFSDFMARGDGLDDAERIARSAAVGPDDLCHIMFTSGTTGAPKGAMLGHGAVCRAYRSWSDVIGLGPDDRYLIINPFFHSFGLNAGILACLMTGATIIPHPVFDVPSVMQRIPEEQITMLPGPPAIYQTILNHPDIDQHDMSTLRLAVTGAAAIPVEMITQMRERLGFETVVTGYGLTESSGIATMCRHDDDPKTIATTSGRPIDDVEVIIVDDDGSELDPGEPGEILVRGYNVMLGYLDDPEQTAEVIDAEGWLHTGDIGVMDKRGYIEITDRKKDMFIVGGFNAYPAEIENILVAHESVADAALVGVPDKRLGEVGMAWVVPAAGTEPTSDELRKWCREEMANYKVPRFFQFVDSLPLNASGKVLKYELRSRGAELAEAAGSELSS